MMSNVFSQLNYTINGLLYHQHLPEIIDTANSMDYHIQALINPGHVRLYP
jgi:hypothetical protein